MFYTYLHLRESDNKPFYIGKGKDKRAWTHKKRNPHWKNTVAKHGLKVEILAEWADEEMAFEHEKFLIECFKNMGHKLVNMTDGGEGFSGGRHTEEWKLAQSGENSVMRRPELCGDNHPFRKMLHLMGENHPNKRQEVRAKISKSKIGDRNPSKRIDVKEKISQSLRIPVSCSNGMNFAGVINAVQWLQSIGKIKASKTGVSTVINKPDRSAYGFKWTRA